MSRWHTNTLIPPINKTSAQGKWLKTQESRLEDGFFLVKRPSESASRGAVPTINSDARTLNHRRADRSPARRASHSLRRIFIAFNTVKVDTI